MSSVWCGYSVIIIIILFQFLFIGGLYIVLGIMFLIIDLFDKRKTTYWIYRLFVYCTWILWIILIFSYLWYTHTHIYVYRYIFIFLPIIFCDFNNVHIVYFHKHVLSTKKKPPNLSYLKYLNPKVCNALCHFISIKTQFFQLLFFLSCYLNFL